MRNCNTHHNHKSSVVLWWVIGLALACPAFAEDVIDKASIEQFWAAMPIHQVITTTDGVPLAYRVFKHPKPKAAIVIVSGRTETFLKYQELIYELYQEGYSVYPYDHRGQGLSGRMLDDRLKGHVASFDNYVSDLQQFLTDVVIPDRPSALHLLSHSMGGAVVIRYLARYPVGVSAAVLGSPMLAPNTGPAGTCLLASAIGTLCSTCATPGSKPATIEERFAANRLTHSELRFRRKEEVFLQTPEALIETPTFGWVREACRIREPLQQDAAQLKTPILLLQAGGDLVVLNAPQTEFCGRKNRLGNSVCEGGTPLVIEGAHHELFFEKDEYREPALRATLAFFERYNAPLLK